jgi:NADPH:quinone reductase-like Zn-dependent oxidoreductase
MSNETKTPRAGGGQMAAMLLTRHGGLDAYTFATDVPVPVPRDGEVLVAVEACAVNNTDINVRADWYRGGIDADGFVLPRIQGADVAGRIAEAGCGVDPARIGERVICDPREPVHRNDRLGRSSRLLGFDRDGGFAEYVVVPAVNAWRVGETADAAELAAYPVAYSTALEMLIRAELRPGDTVLVTGASGGVGAAVVQLAKAMGLRVVAIAGTTKVDGVRALGADVVVARDGAAGPGATAAATRAALAGAGLEITAIADVVGGEQLAELIGLIGAGGRCVTAGAIGGAIAPLDLRRLIYSDIDLRGVSRAEPRTFGALVELVEAGAIRAPVAATYPLHELPQAQERFLRHEHIGKIVVTMPA